MCQTGDDLLEVHRVTRHSCEELLWVRTKVQYPTGLELFEEIVIRKVKCDATDNWNHVHLRVALEKEGQTRELCHTIASFPENMKGNWKVGKPSQ